YAGHVALSHEISAELILDVNADDVVKGVLGCGEAELARTLGLEIARPAVDNAHDESIRLALDARGDFLASNALERGDLLADGGGQAGDGEAAARAGGVKVHGRGMLEEADRRTRRGVPVADGLRHRQHRFLARKRLAQDVREEARRRLVRQTGAD